jgi:hypothetical protein
MKLNPFAKKPDSSQPAQALQYFTATSAMLSRLNRSGGFPLVLVAVALPFIVLLVAVGLRVVDAVAKFFPYLLIFSSLAVVAGTVIYVIDSRRKQKLIEASFLQYNESVKGVFEQYLKNKQQLSDRDFDGIVDKLHDIYISKPAQQTKPGNNG